MVVLQEFELMVDEVSLIVAASADSASASSHTPVLAPGGPAPPLTASSSSPASTNPGSLWASLGERELSLVFAQITASAPDRRDRITVDQLHQWLLQPLKIAAEDNEPALEAKTNAPAPSASTSSNAATASSVAAAHASLAAERVLTDVRLALRCDAFVNLLLSAKAAVGPAPPPPPRRAPSIGSAGPVATAAASTQDTIDAKEVLSRAAAQRAAASSAASSAGAVSDAKDSKSDVKSGSKPAPSNRQPLRSVFLSCLCISQR